MVEIARAADELGYDGIAIPMPWLFYRGPQATPAEKINGLKRFRVNLSL